MKYRKKPVVIEAIQWNGINTHEVTLFCPCTQPTNFTENGEPCLFIKTLEDGPDSQVKHVASKGDYIIKGVNGEFYLCKPDIFNKTYEEV